MIRRAAATLLVLTVCLGAPAIGDGADRHAAPPALVDDGASAEPFVGGKRMAITQYDHGDPSDEEQLFMELMNRARANPQAEADRVLVDYGDSDVTSSYNFFKNDTSRFGVTGREFTRQENHDAFDALVAQPPFAFNPLISEAAQKHTDLMKQADGQSHQFDGELGLRARIEAEGYFGGSLGESVFSFADSMLHAHAGFSVDWGQEFDPATGLPITGHRTTLMNTEDDVAREYREVGIGVAVDNAPGTRVGPRLITIDFAKGFNADPVFVTGVVFDDRNGNLFYDVGEGIGGVRIETDSSDFFAISSTSGGYAVPVPANSGQVVVMAAGEPGTAGEIVGSQQVVVALGTDNVKVDFGAPPEPAIPATRTVSNPGAIPVITDGFVGDATLDMSAFDAETTIGDLEVTVNLQHADPDEIGLSLVSPTGTVVPLFDGGLPGPGIVGSFDGTLTPTTSFAALVGESYVGTWRLRISEQAGGVDGGTLVAWSLTVQPAWIRPLFAPQSSLAIASLKLKDSTEPARDKIILKADLNAGGAVLDATQTGSFQISGASGGDDVLFETALPAPGAPALVNGPIVTKAKLLLNKKDTSRASLVVKISGAELPSLSDRVRVRVAIGGVITDQVIPLAGGKFVGKKQASASPLFFVDKLKSTPGVVRTTVVKGRFASDAPIGAVDGVIDVVVGEFRTKISSADLKVVGTKHSFKSGGALKKLVFDTAKRTFSFKLGADHDVTPGTPTSIELRLGDAFYGRTAVTPRDALGKAIY